MIFAVTNTAGRGSVTSIRSWQVRTSSHLAESGEIVSLAGYRADEWMAASPRSTVMGALLANGAHPDVFFSTTMRDEVDPDAFAVPWWFRSVFNASGAARTFVRSQGIIPRADLWVNGVKVADAAELAGAYVVRTFDVTDLVHRGTNALALLVHPGHPMEDFSIGWWDWSQPPPDHNMGPWRDVQVVQTGDVVLGSPHVTADVDLSSLARATLRVSVSVRNMAATACTSVVAGVISGPQAELSFARTLTLPPGADEEVVFSDAAGDELTLADPALWWPVGEGPQSLYDLTISATTSGGVVSDHAKATFGVRSVDSHVAPGGGRQFVINGRPIPIRGAGWSPDLFLRHDEQRLDDKLALTRNLGLNTIRLEGKLENPEFYDRCDQLGIMVLPGWECCSKWEAAAGTGGVPWDESCAAIAERSMASEAVLLRNHPSVIGFLIGSDFAPPEETAARYVRALRGAGWDLPIVASATAQGTEATGPSGMKMTGPYDWVAPVYWYGDDPARGGAIGFNSEASAGHTVPRLASLRAMLSPAELDQLWQAPAAKQYHSGPPSVFDNLEVFSRALAARYGRPTSLEDYVRKAQLAGYEAARAQFEAYGSRAWADRPATGVIYWMLNSPWPGLNWQLFDFELDGPGSYFGAKKANEALHVQYAYDTGQVQVINRRFTAAGPLTVRARIRRLDGQVVEDRRVELTKLGVSSVADVMALSAPEGLSGAYFVELEAVEANWDGTDRSRANGATEHREVTSRAADSGAADREPASDGPRAAGGEAGVVVSRNVYWLSTMPDVVDLAARIWYAAPSSQDADLQGLAALPAARFEAEASCSVEAGRLRATVTLRNVSPADTPAVALHVAIVAGGRPLRPVFWDDNDVVLFGGESITLTGDAASPAASLPVHVRVDGFNVRRPLVVAVDGKGGAPQIGRTA